MNKSSSHGVTLGGAPKRLLFFSRAKGTGKRGGYVRMVGGITIIVLIADIPLQERGYNLWLKRIFVIT